MGAGASAAAPRRMMIVIVAQMFSGGRVLQSPGRDRAVVGGARRRIVNAGGKIRVLGYRR